MNKFSKHFKPHDQDGFAIITVLFVLALITLSGIMVIQTTNNELQISTNDQINKNSFYAAEAGRTYVIFNGDLHDSKNMEAGKPVSFPEADPSIIQPIDVGSSQSFNGTVQYIESAVPPRGLGYKAGKYQAHRYRMICNGYGPRNSQTRIEAGFFRIRFSL
ncbi:PilX N-terminal domain-containing pilus assembly protein [Thermodesulfobacteriota bacterium]